MVDVSGDCGAYLLAAAKRGNVAFMDRIFEENKDVNLNAADGLGNVALHYSANANHLETLNRLLEKGANPNVQNFAGDTPLHKAVQNDHRAAIQALLEAGADPTLLNKKKLSPVHVAKSHEIRVLLQKQQKEKKELDAFDDSDMVCSDEDD